MNRVTPVLHTEYCTVQLQCYHFHRKLTCNSVKHAGSYFCAPSMFMELRTEVGLKLGGVRKDPLP
jgi:hypothetical protein